MELFVFGTAILVLVPSFCASIVAAGRPSSGRSWVKFAALILLVGCFSFGVLLASWGPGRGDLTPECLLFALPGMAAALFSLLYPFIAWAGVGKRDISSQESTKIFGWTLAGLLGFAIVVTLISWGGWTLVSNQRPVYDAGPD